MQEGGGGLKAEARRERVPPATARGPSSVRSCDGTDDAGLGGRNGVLRGRENASEPAASPAD